MTYSYPYLIPDAPPAELLAELDEATRILDELSARAAELTLGLDGSCAAFGSSSVRATRHAV